MRIKQSVCFPIFRPNEEDLPHLFKELAAIGFAAVEFWDRGAFDDYVSVIESARSSGLAVASMIGYGSLPDGLNKPENHDRIEHELHESIDIAVRNGIPGLICFSGNRNPGQSDFEGMVACSHGLERIAPYAEEKAINLNVELLNSKVNHPGYQCDHTPWGGRPVRNGRQPARQAAL